MTTQKDLECEMEELRLEIKSGEQTISTLHRILERKEQQLKQMNYAEKRKKRIINDNWKVETMNANYPMLEVIDENTVKIEGVEYKKVEKQKPQTLSLYDFLLKNRNTMFSKNAICDIVRKWMIDHTTIETEDEEKVTFTIHKEQLQKPK